MSDGSQLLDSDGSDRTDTETLFLDSPVIASAASRLHELTINMLLAISEDMESRLGQHVEGEIRGLLENRTQQNKSTLVEKIGAAFHRLWKNRSDLNDDSRFDLSGTQVHGRIFRDGEGTQICEVNRDNNNCQFNSFLK